jgi:large subunit ribosomal protein L25
MQIEVTANKRDEQGSSASRRLRRAGRVPGILYGEGKDALAIDLDHKDLMLNLRKEAFHSSVLSMDIDGAKEMALLRDVQVHPYKPLILHVDFQRIAADHKIHLKVPLHFIHAESCPGVKLRGGVVSHIMTEVDVTCLPGQLPEYIEVDLSALDTGASMHLSHLKLPAGVELVQLARGEDPTVVTVLGAKSETEETPGAEGAATA